MCTGSDVIDDTCAAGIRINYTEKHNEEMNHLAYDDIMEMKNPTRPNDEAYMQSYRFWYPLSEMAKQDRIDDNDKGD